MDRINTAGTDTGAAVLGAIAGTPSHEPDARHNEQ